MELIIDASRNQEYIEQHSEEINELREAVKEHSVEFDDKGYRGVYISPEEQEELLAMFSKSVVQDFNDEYHMSKAEREKQQAEYEKFFKLKNGYTWKIRKLDKYVQCYRLIMEIIDSVAETNGVYDPVKFREMVMTGKIKIGGLRFPKFSGKKKKKINWDYVSEFVMDPTRDLRELTEPEDFEKEHMTERAPLSEEEIQYIMSQRQTVEGKLLDDGINLRGGVGKLYASEISSKYQKKLLKRVPALTKIINDYGKSSSSRATKCYELDNKEVQALRSYDEKIRGKDGVPEFNGDVLSSSNVKAYLYAMEEYERQHEYVDRHGRMMTREAADELDYMEMLDQNGWNIRNLYDNKDEEKRRQKAEKASDKRIAILRKTLAKVQERAELQSKGYTKEEIDRKMAEDEKEGKKNKKKKKKAKKECKNIILNAFNAEDESFKQYKKRMEKMLVD